MARTVNMDTHRDLGLRTAAVVLPNRYTDHDNVHGIGDVDILSYRSECGGVAVRALSRCFAAIAILLFVLTSVVAGASEVSQAIQSLQSADWNVRLSAIQSLQSMGIEGVEAVPALISVLQDSGMTVGRELVSKTAISALGQMGPEAAEAVPVLSEILRNRGRLPGQTDEGAGGAGIQEAAATALGIIGVTSEGCVSALAYGLQDPDVAVRRACANSLGKLGPLAATNDAIAALIAALDDPVLAVRMVVSSTLSRIWQRGEALDNMLIRALEDDDVSVRRAAAGAVWRSGAKAVDPLVDTLSDGDREVRLAAVRSLGKIGSKAEMAVQELARMLADEDVGLRIETVATLRSIGGDEVLRALSVALHDECKDVRLAAIDALGKVRLDAAVPILASLFEGADEDVDTLTAAAIALGRYGEKASEAVDTLGDLFGKSRDEKVRSSASQALVSIGSASVPVLKRVAEAGPLSVQLVAVRALEQMGSREATAALSSIKGLVDELTGHVLMEFQDIEDHWARASVEAMARYPHHIVSGVSRTKYAPDSRVTLSEFLGFLSRAAEQGFVDSISPSLIEGGERSRPLTRDEAALIVGQRFVEGVSEYVTRAEAAVILRRVVTRDETPVLFWATNNVRPGQTAMVYGGGIFEDAIVEAARVGDGSMQGLEDEQPLAHGFSTVGGWQVVPAIQPSEESVKLVIPENWEMGIYEIRVRAFNGEISNSISVNAPGPLWLQADEGRYASPGGWIRIFGQAMSFASQARVLLTSSSGQDIILVPSEQDEYSLTVAVPVDLPVGVYGVSVHNGFGGDTLWEYADSVIVQAPLQWPDIIHDVTEFGADPTGTLDSSDAIAAALARCSEAGGGVVYLPRGVYRTARLVVPEFTVVRGDGSDFTYLVWTYPDNGGSGGAFITGRDHFAIEDLSIYTQTNPTLFRDGLIFTSPSSSAMIRGGSGARVSGTRIRSYSDGRAMEFSGENIKILDNDIYSRQQTAHNTAAGLYVGRVTYGIISGNTINAGNGPLGLVGSKIIVEGNELLGAELTASGSCIGIDTYHIYMGGNRSEHMYGNDREALTLDGHGTAYYGRVEEVEDTKVVVAEHPWWGVGGKEAIDVTRIAKAVGDATGRNWHGIILFVLYGKGAGQYRNLVSVNGRELELDRPFDVTLDESSVVSIGVYNGQHLVIGNEWADAGSVQLYAPNIEIVVADNTFMNINDINGLGCARTMTWGLRIEPSWFNEWRGNRIAEGSSWDTSGNATPARININADAFGRLPILRGAVIRDNVVENQGTIVVSGTGVVDVVVEANDLKTSDIGIAVKYDSSRAYARMNNPGRSFPSRVLIKDNTFDNVDLEVFVQNE